MSRKFHHSNWGETPKFCNESKLNVIIMDKKSNKANYFWNSYQNAVLESGIPEKLIQRNKLIPRVCLLQ